MPRIIHCMLTAINAAFIPKINRLDEFAASL